MKKLLPLVLLLLLSSLAFAAPVTVTIDFEELASYTQITNQYAAQNAFFTNALQLNVPDYNYFDYPPHSGIGVATNDPNDPMVVYFTANVDVNSINFWYAAPDGIIATAYDAFGNVLDSVNGPGVDGGNLWLPFSGSGLAR